VTAPTSTASERNKK